MKTNTERERNFFDNVANKSSSKTISKKTLMRYASPQWPQLFSKEKMFKLAGDLRGKKVLEIGCGEGIASVQLSYCGAQVDAIDLSPVSIDQARRNAIENGEEKINFIVCDFTQNGEVVAEKYDVIWCDLVLHHLTDNLETVIKKIEKMLKKDGLLIVREPLAYANWLKKIRNFVPVPTDATPGEQPFRDIEFLAIARFFPNYQKKYYGILARASRVINNLFILRLLARIDNLLLLFLPGSKVLAGYVVLWARKGSPEKLLHG